MILFEYLDATGERTEALMEFGFRWKLIGSKPAPNAGMDRFVNFI
jgi:hypothetical protein